MSDLFVVPCKYDPARPVVVECVSRIRRHHPDADVLVVDSASADRSYFDDVAAQATVADVENQHYMFGAYRYALGNSDADFFYLIQDSLLLNAPIPRQWGTVRWFSDPPHPWGWNEDGSNLRDWGAPRLARLGLGCPDTYRGLLGPMWFCSRQLMDELARIGFWDIEVTTKWEACAMERVTGIVLEHLGYDVTASLQGEHRGHFDRYPDEYVTKLDMARM